MITAIVQNCCPENYPGINLNGKAKTSLNCWKSKDPKTGKELSMPKFEMSESEVVFRLVSCEKCFIISKILIKGRRVALWCS